jgi:transcriptional regulator with XRE-family HTH domain
MNPAQCRAARGLLDWTQTKLADAAGIAPSTVLRFEQIRMAVSAQKVQAMQRALEAAGIEFTNGNEPGVKLRKGGPRGDPAASITVEDLTSENDE